MSGTSSLTGDFADLDRLIEALDGAALAEELRRRAAAGVAERAERQYAAGQGPEDETWPVNTSNSRWPSLRRLTAGISFRATEDGIAATGDPILQYHHDRSALYAHLERRTFPPAGELSAPWAAAVDVEAADLFAEWLGG